MTVKIVEFPGVNACDVPAKLREVADNIEAGLYGEVGEIALVVLGDTLSVHGFGPNRDPTSTASLLGAGQFKLIRAIADVGTPQAKMG